MKKEIVPDSIWRANYSREYKIKYPDAQVTLLGRSILGRDIDCFKLGLGKKHIVVVGAHHATEYITASALYDFLSFMQEKVTRGESFCNINIDFLLQLFTFWIVPCLNPDGVELHLNGVDQSPLAERQRRMSCGAGFASWQANARGVDLNHNYDAGFFEYKHIEAENRITPGNSRFAGEFPESEPETRALACFIRSLAPSIVVSLHTQGKEIYSQPRCERVDRAADRICKALAYRHEIPTGFAAYGGLCDYTGAVLGIPSFTVELGFGENPLPHSQLPSICDTVRKLLVLLPSYL
jgi:g-D-glutamyl-meso-diaminopimelate peptidase